jgi:hypothetical protein
MKKIISYLTVLALFCITYIAISCKHEIPVNADAGCSSFLLSTTFTNSTTANPNSGTITATATGGIVGLIYSINTTPITTNQTGLFTDLAAGIYTITSTSGNCIKTTLVTLTNTGGGGTDISFTRDIQPVIYNTCGQATCHNHNNNYNTYADIVGTPGTTWSTCSKLNSFVPRVVGTNSISSSGNHDMPTSGTASWTTFVNTYFIPWINQGFQNN